MVDAHKDVTATRLTTRSSRGLRRVGDAEREATCEELTQHFVLGRLSQDELDARLALATRAQYDGDLSAVVADLPPFDESRVEMRETPSVAVPLVIAIVSCLGMLGALAFAGLEASGGDSYVPTSTAFAEVLLTAVFALIFGVSAARVAQLYTQRLRLRIQDELSGR